MRRSDNSSGSGSWLALLVPLLRCASHRDTYEPPLTLPVARRCTRPYVRCAPRATGRPRCARPPRATSSPMPPHRLPARHSAARRPRPPRSRVSAGVPSPANTRECRSSSRGSRLKPCAGAAPPEERSERGRRTAAGDRQRQRTLVRGPVRSGAKQRDEESQSHTANPNPTKTDRRTSRAKRTSTHFAHAPANELATMIWTSSVLTKVG